MVDAPSLRIIASADGTALLRIEPGTWPWNVSPGAKERPAAATVFLYDANKKDYHFWKTFTLRNPISPATAIISNGGKWIATFDDWDPSIGQGENVLVLYRESGEFVKAWKLEDIFSAEEIAALQPREKESNKERPLTIGDFRRVWRSNDVSFITDSKGEAIWIPFSPDHRFIGALRVDLASKTIRKIRGEKLESKSP